MDTIYQQKKILPFSNLISTRRWREADKTDRFFNFAKGIEFVTARRSRAALHFPSKRVFLLEIYNWIGYRRIRAPMLLLKVRAINNCCHLFCFYGNAITKFENSNKFILTNLISNYFHKIKL